MPTVLITGASRGIGLEFVRQYAAEGWTVLAVVRDPMSGRAASDAGGDVYIADVADGGSIARLARSLGETGIDVLINNAGLNGAAQDLGQVDGEEFLRLMRVNALGPLKMAEALVDRMTGAKIIASVSSQMGSIAQAGGGAVSYRASKAALNMVMRDLSIEWKARGIIAVSLSPGWVRTDMGGADAPLSPEQSVRGMRAVLNKLTPADSGKFFATDGGELPW